MKNQLLFSLSLLLVATSAFAEGNITLQGLNNNKPSLVEKAKAFWAEKTAVVKAACISKSEAIAQWTQKQKATVLGKTATAKDYAQAFWNAPRSVKKDIVAAACGNAKEFALNNKLNLGGSFIAALGAYNLLSLVPGLNTEKSHPMIYGKKIKDAGFKKWAKVAAKLSASSALFAYLVSHQSPDKAAAWAKGLFPCKNNA